MAKAKLIVARNAAELGKALALSKADVEEMRTRRGLASKIIEVVEETGLTHADVAKLAGTARSRVTAMMNHNISGISTDVLLRVLASLGYRAKISFSRIPKAA